MKKIESFLKGLFLRVLTVAENEKLKTENWSFLGCLFFAVMITFIPVTVLGQTWDVAQQFDTSNNPASSSPWSYGYSSVLGGAFNLLTVQDDMYSGTPGWARTSSWGDWGYPRVYKNTSASQINYQTLHIPSNALVITPGYQAQSYQYVIARWTAPFAGTFHINGSFSSVNTWIQENNAIGADANILLNSESKFHSDVIYGNTVTDSYSVQLSAGDTVDFVVGRGSDGDITGDETQLEASIASVNINDSLVAYYPFNGNANDESGNGNNGMVNGATLTTDRLGSTNSAYSFNGIDSYIQAVNPVNIPVGNTPRTITAWVRCEGQTAGNRYQTIVSYGTPWQNTQTFLFERGGDAANIYNNKLTVIGWNNDFSGSADLDFDEWYYVAATFDGSTAKVYINGVLDGSAEKTYNTVINGDGLKIGDSPSNDGWHKNFKGSIDEIRIYNRALSGSEIQQLYTGSSSKVLVAGGNTSISPAPPTAEVYDQATDTWSSTANNITHTCVGGGMITMLGNGKALFAGGGCGADDGSVTNRASIYDPATNLWSAGGPMSYGRQSFALITLADGNAMAIGGCSGGCSGGNVLGQGVGTVGRAAEIYSLTNSWNTVSPLNIVRAISGTSTTYQRAVTLQDGRVLVCGGCNGFSTVYNSCEIYDPSADTWTYTIGVLPEATDEISLALLKNGKVLAVMQYSVAAVLFDPTTGIWSSTGAPVTYQHQGTLTLLNNGEVLMTGGYVSSGGLYTTLSTAQIYNPTTGVWRSTGSMGIGRSDHFALLLDDGKVLVGGGVTGAGYWSTNWTEYLSSITNSAEIYDPATEIWSPTGSMSQSRATANAVLLKTVIQPSTFEFTDDFESYAIGQNPTSFYDYYYSTWESGEPAGVDRFQTKFFDESNTNKVLNYSYSSFGPHFPWTSKLYKQDFDNIDKVGASYLTNGNDTGFTYLRVGVNDNDHGYTIFAHYTNSLMIYESNTNTTLAEIYLWPDSNILYLSHRIEIEKIGDSLIATVVRLDTNESKSVSIITDKIFTGRAGFGFGGDNPSIPVNVNVDNFYVRGTVAASSDTDTTPDAFTFTDQADVALNTSVVVSNSITVSGIDAPSPISISGGEYSINGGAFTSASGTVNNGNTVRVRQTSSGSFSTTTNTALTIGGISDTFSVTTIAADTTPDQFTFPNETNAPLNTFVMSGSIIVSGINAPSQISISGGTYSVNGGSFTPYSGTVNNGDGIRVRLTTSGNYSTPTIATLTIGGVSGTFSVTTVAAPVPSTYTITPSAGLHGTISPSTLQTVAYLSTPSFTITPDPGYHIATVDGTCSGTLSGSIFTISPITADCTVSVSFAANTADNTVPTGGSVTVTPIAEVSLTFENVTTGGTLTAAQNSNPSPPANFRIPSGGSYEITFTGSFTGPVTVCFSYDPADIHGNESNLKLMHREVSGWVDITSAGYPDTTNHIICGVTTSFSEFAVMEFEQSSSSIASGNMYVTANGQADVLCSNSTCNGSMNNGYKLNDTSSPSAANGGDLYINWGDGTPIVRHDPGGSFTHTYNHIGKYRVTQTVKDSDGNGSQQHWTVNVSGGTNGKGTLLISASGSEYFNIGYKVMDGNTTITTGTIGVGGSKSITLDPKTYSVKFTYQSKTPLTDPLTYHSCSSLPAGAATSSNGSTVTVNNVSVSTGGTASVSLNDCNN